MAGHKLWLPVSCPRHLHRRQQLVWQRSGHGVVPETQVRLSAAATCDSRWRLLTPTAAPADHADNRTSDRTWVSATHKKCAFPIGIRSVTYSLSLTKFDTLPITYLCLIIVLQMNWLKMISFLPASVPDRIFGVNWHSFYGMEFNCTPYHPTNMVKTLKKTQNTDLNQWSGLSCCSSIWQKRHQSN